MKSGDGVGLGGGDGFRQVGVVALAIGRGECFGGHLGAGRAGHIPPKLAQGVVAVAFGEAGNGAGGESVGGVHEGGIALRPVFALDRRPAHEIDLRLEGGAALQLRGQCVGLLGKGGVGGVVQDAPGDVVGGLFAEPAAIGAGDDAIDEAGLGGLMVRDKSRRGVANGRDFLSDGLPQPGRKGLEADSAMTVSRFTLKLPESVSASELKLGMISPALSRWGSSSRCQSMT